MKNKEKKKCRVCGEEKLLTEFNYRKDSKTYRTECKECRREYRKEYNKEYRKNNKEKIAKIQKEYKKNNKEKINKYKRDRHNNSPSFRLNSNISRGIHASLKSNNISKNGRHWESLVGYASQELRDHLEKLFLPGMTWENYSKYGWHIDHIIAKSFFVFTSTDNVEFKYCWSLDNLQPLWAEDNWSKSNKIIY